MVLSLGVSSRRDAIIKGTALRADILRGACPTTATAPALALAVGQIAPATTVQPASTPQTTFRLRDVFDKWVEAKHRSKSTISACTLALEQFEAQTGNPAVSSLSRASGIAFRTWLQHPDRNTASKTARDRLTWVKSLLKFAVVEMEIIPRSPWERLDIEAVTVNKRRPWTEAELKKLFGQPLHAQRVLPAIWKAGGEAAYWIPLLGLYTGARVGELAQMRVADVDAMAAIPVLSITDEGDGQQVKTEAGIRLVPIHSELIRLGFLDYVDGLRAQTAERLWPDLKLPAGRPGIYFSNWFGDYRRAVGFGKYPDFHCLRHTVRSALAGADVSEPMIDQLMGHEIKGSTGAKTYTHRTMVQMKSAIEKLNFPAAQIVRLYPTLPST